MFQSPAYLTNPLDRADHLRNNAAEIERLAENPHSKILPIWDSRGLIDVTHGPAQLAWLSSSKLKPFRDTRSETLRIFLGIHDGIAHFAEKMPDWDKEEIPEKINVFGKFIDVRTITMQLSADQAGILAQARSIVEWHGSHGFCAKCGTASQVVKAGMVRLCPQCGAEHFPRVDPVTIMVIHHMGRLLLGRQPKFPPGMWSCLAGYVEPGEAIEAAVRREAKEEAGIEIGDVTYLLSQPWPFPSSLMIGIFAEALTTDVVVDGLELDDARWFSREEIGVALKNWSKFETSETRLPPPLSIAYAMCKNWYEGG